MEQNENKILIHACCGICSGYPISLLKDMGYVPVVYYCNPNLDTKEEFERRLDAQKKVCEYLKNSDIRASVDDRNETLGKRIREIALLRVPVLAIVGEKEVTEGTVSVRQDGVDKGSMALEAFGNWLHETMAAELA